MFGLFKKKKETETVDLISNVKELMEELDVPSWLQGDLVNILKKMRKKMRDEELSDWLKQRVMSEDFIIPEDFQNEKSLNLCYKTHGEWVQSQINDYAALSYEDSDILMKKLPDAIKRLNHDAQKAYLAVSVCLLNVFSQLD